MYAHTMTRIHATLETTAKVIYKIMRVPKGLRKLIREVISECRLLEKKTLGLKIADHPEARTVFAPCFHSCMMDICYGFRRQAYKQARMVVKVYGLEIVC